MQKARRKLSDSGPAAFSQGRADTGLICGARKQLLTPSKDLSNFFPGGRTGYVGEKLSLQTGLLFSLHRKPCCFSQPRVSPSWENAQRFGLLLSDHQ